MTREKRIKQPPIPEDYEKLLTNEQLLTIGYMQRFGWYLYFVRRPLFQEVTAVLRNYEMEYQYLRWVHSDGSTSNPYFDIRLDDYGDLDNDEYVTENGEVPK